MRKEGFHLVCGGLILSNGFWGAKRYKCSRCGEEHKRLDSFRIAPEAASNSPLGMYNDIYESPSPSLDDTTSSVSEDITPVLSVIEMVVESFSTPDSSSSYDSSSDSSPSTDFGGGDSGGAGASDSW